MTQRFVNNYATTVAQTFGATDTYLRVASPVGLPVLGAGDYLLLTVFRKVGQNESGHEVVRVTAITTDLLTVVRGVEGAAASLFIAGDRVEGRLTAMAMHSKADVVDLTTHGTNNNNPHGVTKAQVGLSNADNTSDANKPVSAAQAAALGAKQATLVSGTNVKTINGISLLGTGDVLIVGAKPSLQGDLAPYVTQSKSYVITNYNSFSTYVAQSSSGVISLSGDTVTFTAPTTSGQVALTLVVDGASTVFNVNVRAASVLTPVINTPALGAIGVEDSPTINATAFSTVGLADTYLNTDWELWTGPNRTGSKVASNYSSTSDTTSWTIAAGLIVTNTTYYPAVSYRGKVLGSSEWATSSFTTATSFNSYIPTPTPTPTNYGDPFEGGFYMGLFWNQIMQSSSSKALAIGTQIFAVPDMATVPKVYAGQQLEVRSRTNPANKFIGTVAGAIGTSLTLTVSSIGGNGTFSDWSVMSKFRHIEAPKASGEHAGIALKSTNTALPVACQTLTEGWEATLAMVAAGDAAMYPAPHWARSLIIGGKNDWHIPARDVRELSWRNGKPTTDANYTATRETAQSFNYKRDGSYGDAANTQGTNNNSIPLGAAYTSSAPAQTTAAAFKIGGVEAFEYGSAYYWTSSEYNETSAWCQRWHSSHPGSQNSDGKASTFRVRAARRSII